MAVLSPAAKMAFTTAAGTPLVGGKLYTYIAGTTTPQTTYIDSSATTANTNPVVLDSRGEANLWLGGALYKFILKDADDALIWSVDNISAPTSAVSPVLSGNVVIDSNTSSPALKITQTGSGLALQVQDSADPDASPFVVDSIGRVGIGTGAPASALEIAAPGVFTGAWAYLPSGTKMMFVQTSAPTGWTKSVTDDNKALRVVSGAASTGGSVPFTTAFTSQALSGSVGATALTEANLPTHYHTVVSRTKSSAQIAAGTASYVMLTGTTDYIGTGSVLTDGGSGTGTTHTHTFGTSSINLAVQYVDVIIATKD
tara:strand:- start:6890 stop:7828 length:939 start_codon:yes stop_codon:yes gene_type:complete